MNKLAIVLCLCGLLALPALADRTKGVPAHLAAADYPTPTFAEIHERFMAISVNESGFFSLADQDGILQSLLHGGGGRKPGRSQKGQGYGLDYKKLMRQMARHSTRTFPIDSKYLLLPESWFLKRQTRLNRWTSTLRLDCSQPSGWPKTKPDGSPMMSWRLVYKERCERLVATTRQVLKGLVPSYCDGQPTTWGSVSDITRAGGALDQGWTEVHCDRPPMDSDICGKKTKLEIWTSTSGCARNTFWTWLLRDKEDTHGTEAGRRGTRKQVAHGR